MTRRDFNPKPGPHDVLLASILPGALALAMVLLSVCGAHP